MRQSNTIGVDLAKNVIQVAVVTPANKEISNRELTRSKFAEFLAKQKSGLVAFEACATAHHWARVATSCGHQVKIVPAIAVIPFRQGHKTDKNDALAVAEAANRPNIKVAAMKSIEQQSMQSIQRSRELIIQERTALSNHIRGLLLEFGLAIPKGLVHLRKHLPLLLEDAENGLPMSYRPTLQRMSMRFRALDEDLAFMDEQINQVVNANVIGISRRVANRRLHSVLIQGARYYVHARKQARSGKDEWMLALVARSGTGKAAVALANKNVRTAWAILTQGTEYNCKPRLANSA